MFLNLYLQLFEYERLVKILLHAVSDTEQEGFVQRIAIYLLNSLACLVDGKQKLFLGDLGAISVCKIILSKQKKAMSKFSLDPFD